MLSTILTNRRDFFFFFTVGIGLALLSGAVDYIAPRLGLGAWTASLMLYLGGFSRFVGANFCAIFFGLMAWPTVNYFGNHCFSAGWALFSNKEKTLIYMGLLLAEGLIAAICFAQ